MNTRPAASRRAWTLVEMMVAISGCAVILTTSVALIHRTMRAQSESQSFFNIERSAQRLSTQFRQDAHRATGAAANDGSPGGVLVRLDLRNGQTVEYQASAGTLVRTLFQGGHAQSRDHFAFHSACDVEVQQLDSPHRLVLTVTSHPGDTRGNGSRQVAKHTATPVAVRVEASLNRGRPSLATATTQEPSP